jgi:hypothetical protein
MQEILSVEMAGKLSSGGGQARAGRSAGCAVAQGPFFLGGQNFSIGLYLYSVKKIKSKWAVFVGLIVNEKGTRANPWSPTPTDRFDWRQFVSRPAYRDSQTADEAAASPRGSPFPFPFASLPATAVVLQFFSVDQPKK